MQRPEFTESHGEIDFIGRIKASEDGVSGLDQATDALGIVRQLGYRERMADRVAGR